MERPSSQAFQQSRPILLTTFTNRVGSIGLSLIAILLVDRGVSTAEGTLVLGTLKATIIAGTLAGGALAFPLVIHADRVLGVTLLIGVTLPALLGLLYWRRDELARLA